MRVRMLMTNNPAMRMSQAFRAQGQQLRFLGSMPRQMGKRLIPKRFRMANPRSGGGADDDLPEEDDRQTRAYERSRSRRRVRAIARREAFTQIHLSERGTATRTVLHIGSATGASFCEFILNPGTRQAIQLQFYLVDEVVHGAPLLLRLASGPRDTTVTVDNAIAAPEAPVRKGSVVSVNGRLFDVGLFAAGNLPAVTRVDAAWETNVGPVRDQNQDAIGIYQHPSAYMFTVADGVGGGFAGEEMSAFAVKYLLSVFQRNIAYEHFSWYDVYAKAFAYINAEVRNFITGAPSAGGTTLTSVFIRNWTVYVAHVGDSRVYHLRGQTFRQLTTDHNRELERETRNRDGRPTKVRQTILQKAIGQRDDIDPDVETLALQPGDMLLLTTDGVTNNVSDDELYAMLTTKRLTDIPRDLVALTNERQNTDNASVIAINVLEEAYDRDVWVADPEDRVYVGGPAWYLKLQKPSELRTMYSIITGTMTLLVVIAIFALIVLWSGIQVRRFARWLNNPAGFSVTVDEREMPAAMTEEADIATMTPTLTLIGAEVMVTHTFTPIPTQTPTVTRTPLSTVTPFPTRTPTPPSTLIPLTSTSRPRQ